ncbi:hypothetical protein SAV14893_066990 [Streptomyces avermitilis]|uniref:Uncharacterized protein n=1 Tax=Streptomyces avermitilis TaxID=33903 RepID=A0A4D4M5X7_STRAX|nr:hypothetical protein SAV14893_066990 [Streptomyces avermitilis]GDY72403.1 hypothetical protein SAV31267_018880 [Streptomyces avermitilis]GDY81545.1 hypothetical protein SAVCW2_07440 [Streptomyces avermitilis]
MPLPGALSFALRERPWHPAGQMPWHPAGQMPWHPAGQVVRHPAGQLVWQARCGPAIVGR